METGLIYKMVRHSVHDGPGIRTTVFMKGCPLGCWWCHNPESQSMLPELMYWDSKCISCGQCLQACAHGAITGLGFHREKCVSCGRCAAVCCAGARELVGRQVTVPEVMSVVERDVAFYDQSGGGVTFSGGEPLAQPAFLRSLLLACKKRSIHAAVDTSGFASAETLRSSSELADLFLYDLKLMDEKRHREYTGVSNQPILGNLQDLAQKHNNIYVRFPLIPGVNDDPANVSNLGAFVATLPRVKRIYVLPYQRMGMHKYERLCKRYLLDGIAAPSTEEVDRVVRVLQGFGLNVKVGG